MASHQERRKYYRIQDQVALEYLALTTEEYDREKNLFYNQPSGLRLLKNKYANFLPPGLEVENTAGFSSEFMTGLVKMIITINEKLDLILAYLEKKENYDLYQKQPQTVSLSGEGIGFSVPTAISKGCFIKVNFLLPQTPPFLIPALGKVVHLTAQSDRGQKEYEVGISFLDIHKDDQEAIIKYIFMRQRDMLRNRENG